MATKNSVVKVSPAGLVDGQQTGLIKIPDFDPAHFVAPGANGTWTKYTSATEATAQTAQTDAGYVVIDMGGTLYRIPAYLTT